MLKNYLKTSLRNLIRHKGYAFINIFGLTIGLATSIFIFLWVLDEISYDQFHVKSDRIFRVMINDVHPNGKIETYSATPMLLADVLKTELPEIDEVAQLSWGTDMLLKHGEKSFNESGFYSDPTLFSVFSFPITKGDASKPLPDVKSIAISERLAKKFFDKQDPIGKIFQVNHAYDLMVTSVFRDIPKNSTLQFDFIISFDLWKTENPWAAQNWGTGGMQTLVTLNSGAHLETANEKLKGVIKKNCEDCTKNPFLFQYSKSRLHNEFENGKSTGGQIDLVILFSLVAGIVLTMACINFMNLAAARSGTRSREVGVRKVIGAQRSGLIVQFISESLLLSFSALLFALVAVELLLPFFNAVSNKSVRLDFGDPLFVSGTLLITLVCGLLAGSYPAFFLSSFKPAAVLKGNAQSFLSGSGLRKTLVGIQFTTSMILIIGSIVIHNQIIFINNKNLGFDKENVIVIDQHEGILKNQSAFKNELLQFPSVKSIGFGGNNIFTIPITTTDPKWPGKSENSSISFKIMRCDQGLIPTMNIRLLAGRNFTDLNKQDASNYIINTKAMEVMGLGLDNVIGADLEMWNGKGKIIGVTNDFNNGNLREGIQPLIFLYSTDIGWHYFIKVDGKTKTSETLAHIKKTLKKYDPDYPFHYEFLDEVFDREYSAEATIGKLSLSFTTVAVLISCLGLFGLASFTAERRIKELGIRKVMGASAINLIIMLCSDFSKLVTIGIIIGCPVAWYLATDYLSSYAFHYELNKWIFVITGATVLFIALMTVVYQAARAAMANPVNSLRND